jgi:hypothetical protein
MHVDTDLGFDCGAFLQEYDRVPGQGDGYMCVPWGGDRK